jgi:uncharacterized integral membrane protein
MWRLIGFILIFAVFLAFIVFNLNNRCDVSFGFTSVTDMPVFITAFVSFFLGMLCAVPFFASFRRKKQKNQAADVPAETGKKWGPKSKTPAGGTQGQDGPFGID